MSLPLSFNRQIRGMLALAVLGLFALSSMLFALLALRVAHPSLLQKEITYRVDLPTVVEEVRSLARLETASFTAEKIVEAKSAIDPLPAWFVGDRVLLVAHGTVVAGVDLSRLTAGDVTATSGVVHIHLPPAQIISVALDPRSYVYDHHPGLFSRVNPDLESEARDKAEDEIRSAALSSGLLKRAAVNARATLEKLIRSAGARQVIFDSGTTPAP